MLFFTILVIPNQTLYADSPNLEKLKQGVQLGHGVIAKLSDGTLHITGGGTIERAKWEAMAQLVDPHNFSKEFGWSGNENFDIDFEDDEDKSGKKVFLPSDCNCLFYRFDRQINFGKNDVSTRYVTNMNSMFESTSFNLPLEFDTSNVTDMSDMFYDAKYFNQPLNFDTSNVTNMSGMFLNAKYFNQPLNFDTSNVTNMSGMFLDAESFNQPINFNTTKVEDMGSMFSGASSFNNGGNVLKLDIHGLDVVKHIGTHGFYPGLSCTFNHSNISRIELDPHGGDNIWASFRPDDEKDAFSNAKNLESLEFSGLSENHMVGSFKGDFIVENLSKNTKEYKTKGQKVHFLSNDHYKLYLADLSTPFKLNADSDLNSYVTAQLSADESTLNITGHGQIDKAKWEAMARLVDTQNYSEHQAWGGNENFDIVFNSDSRTNQIKLPIDSKNLFRDFDRQIYFGTNGVDTSDVTNMLGMFYRAKAFNQPLEFVTNNVTDMAFMFYGAEYFNQPLNFNTSNVTNMRYMFAHAKQFNQPLNFNTSKVVDMQWMFMKAENFNQRITFDTKNVTDMTRMFYGASSFINGANLSRQNSAEEILTLNISNLHDNPSTTASTEGLSEAFCFSKIAKLKLKVKDENGINFRPRPTVIRLSINANAAFSNAKNLKYLEFEGLSANTMQNSFSADFNVVNFSKNTIEKKHKGDKVNFLANDHYLLYVPPIENLHLPKEVINRLQSPMKVNNPSYSPDNFQLPNDLRSPKIPKGIEKIHDDLRQP